MAAKSYAVYKGLQKPLVYRGFKGRYIYWVVGSVVSGIFLGGAVMSFVNMVCGAIIMICCFAGGIYYTTQKQKAGLYDKTRDKGIYVHKVNLRGIRNVQS